MERSWKLWQSCRIKFGQRNWKWMPVPERREGRNLGYALEDGTEDMCRRGVGRKTRTGNE